MATLKIDQLNQLNSVDIESILKRYFKEMDEITDEQVEERTQFGKDLFDILLAFMVLVATTDYVGGIQDIDYYIDMISRQYADLIIGNNYVFDQYMKNYVDKMAQEIVNSTFTHINETYYLSDDRALAIAESESNTAINYQDYVNAVQQGFTKKQWITEKDNRVRKTHMEVDDNIIAIDKYFVVGDSYMRFPHDLSMGASAREIVNCRCHIKYIR